GAGDGCAEVRDVEDHVEDCPCGVDRDRGIAEAGARGGGDFLGAGQHSAVGQLSCGPGGGGAEDDENNREKYASFHSISFMTSTFPAPPRAAPISCPIF